MGAPLISMPVDTPVAGLLELTRAGELFVLPEHNARRFRALLITQAPQPCQEIERAMMDVKSYPKRWKQMTKVRATREGKNRVRYSYELDLMFSPRLKGIVENPRPGIIRYLDEDVASDFTWKLSDEGGVCHMVERMVQPEGVRSGFVRLLQNLEDGAADAAELAGALAASRGWSEPSLHRLPRYTAIADDAWDRLSGAGTVIHLINRVGNKRMLVRARKRVRASPEAVLKSIRHRKGYLGKKGVAGIRGVDFLDDIELEGHETEWEVEYFGGDVDFRTSAKERGRVTDRRGLRITERVVAGDLKTGYWTWSVRRVPGGTSVDLEIDIDVTEGSLVLRMLGAQDPLIGRTNALQLALEFLRVVVPYRALPTPPRVTAAAQ